MDFLEVAVVDIDGEAAETVSELFNRYGQGGAVIEAYSPDFVRVTVRTVIPNDDPDQRRHLEAMLALISQALPHGLPEARWRVVGESDWAESWKEHFHVVRVAERFVIKPSWRDYQPQAADLLIEIDPGLAFGSGLHPTTQLCLEILGQLPLAGQSLFDVGTGSGILTIAAARLGARPLRAVDVDEVAVRIAEENFALNGVPAETAVGSAESTGGRKWQVVVANILAHILHALLPNLAAALAPQGRLILSGLIAEQEAEMRAAIATQGLHVVSRHQQEDWVALVVGH